MLSTNMIFNRDAAMYTCPRASTKVSIGTYRVGMAIRVPGAHILARSPLWSCPTPS